MCNRWVRRCFYGTMSTVMAIIAKTHHVRRISSRAGDIFVDRIGLVEGGKFDVLLRR